MNRSNVPYIVAAALLVLAFGGWGIFMTGGNHEPAEVPDAGGGADVGAPGPFDAGVDLGREDPGAADAGAVDAGVVDVGASHVDGGVVLGAPPRTPDAGLLHGANAANIVGDAGIESEMAGAGAKPETGRSPKKSGAISPDAIRSVVAGMKPAAKLCYERLLEEFPEASGDVTVSFRIEADGEEGRVTIIEVDERTTLMDDKLLACLTDAFGDAVFPVPEGGDTVQVTYPFKFATKSK